ncbi:MAG: FtsX-like permease family protein [Acidobacteria bacterium]|nr:FtsX-like permease family protein [Acidobacteriota bacterium]
MTRSPLLTRLCLYSFPPQVRDEYGADLADLIHERRAQEANAGLSALALFYARTIRDALGVAWRRRVRRQPFHNQPNIPPELPHWKYDMLLQDVRYGIRTLWHRPWFSLAVIATLALGIGANTLIYSTVDAVILNPFDMPDPDQVVMIGTEYPRLAQPLQFFEVLSGPEYTDIVDGASTLSHAAGFDLGNRQVMGGDVPQNVFTAFWWIDPLPTLALQPVVGRSFNTAEIAEREPVAMLSERVWLNRFAGDEDVVGTTIRIDDDPYTLIGVFPNEANIYGTDLWMPMYFPAAELPRGQRRQFNAIGRLDDDVSLADLNAELEGIARRTELEFGDELPEYSGWRIRALTYTDAQVSTMKPAGVILLGAVGFVLLLVCANVASLLLSRSASRQREISVRIALGAGRLRVLRQLMSESLVLAVVGASLGIVFAWFGLEWLQANVPSNLLPTTRGLSINSNVLGYTAIITVASAILFGLAPALHATRVDLQRTLGSGVAGGGGARKLLHSVFVAVEVALALVLLTGASLFMTSLWRLQQVDLGFAPDNVLTMRLTLPWSKYEGDGIAEFFNELIERSEAIPGVTSAAAVSQRPPNGFSTRQFSLPGTVVENDSELPNALLTIASHTYFDTLGVPITRGRAFNQLDRGGATLVAVINETFAQRHLERSGEEVIGQRIKLGRMEDPELPWLEVVGVVDDMRNGGLQNATQPEIFVSLDQVGGVFNQLFMVIRTDRSPLAALPAVREAVAGMDPDQPIYAIGTMRDVMMSGFAIEAFAMVLLAAFGVTALILAASGIFGVVAYGVSQRSREIGVRMALGAGGTQVRQLIVRQAALPIGIGALVGLGMSIALGVAATGFLSEVGSFEPLALIGVGTVLTLVALSASYLPARRASRVDPVRALRAD